MHVNYRPKTPIFNLIYWPQTWQRANLFWAFIYNVVGSPLAVVVLYPVFGVLLSHVFAAAAMAMSSASVLSNSLCLRHFRPS